MNRALILVDPLPRTLDLICEPSVRARLEALGRLEISEDRPMPDSRIEALLPEVSLIFGQTAMPRSRLDRAPKLKGVINVESNFLPNIDYQACTERGIWVITPGGAFASPVAEMALGMAIDLGRGLTEADRAFRAGKETYGLEGNEGTVRLFGADVGIIGFGDLGRATRELLRPFKNRVRVYDPWLPELTIRQHDCEATTLTEVLETSRFLFVFAGVTSENQGFLGKDEFARMRKGACFLLLSRAAVVDFQAMLDAAASGHIRVAVDVFPEEPVPAGDRVRSTPNVLLSAHRAGGTRDALYAIGEMAVADAELILKGLAPQLCRRADPATAARLRSKPVAKT
ncbi:MAG: hydroxyacid dehydrogenase [Opitutaceae bacterium]|nr:hydroxyacid dehydrogenase [Opitutaceae bacterium]